MKDWLLSMWAKAWFNDVRCPVPKKWRWPIVALVAVVVLVVVWA